MKLKLSISVDEELIKIIEEKVKEGRFRNKSHVLEYAAKKLLEEEKDA